MTDLNTNNNCTGNLSNCTTTTDDPYMDDDQNEIMMVPVLTIIYTFIFIIGVIGNSLVILVIIKDRKMRSVANFFLISLSAADLMIILFCLPIAVYELFHSSEWIFGIALCKLTPYLQYVSVNASVLTMLAISFERLFVICVPLKARSYCTKRRTTLVIACVWAACAVTSFPAFMYTTIIEYPESPEVNATACITQTEGHEWYLICQSVFFYVCPGLMLLVIYVLIIKSLRNCAMDLTLQANTNSRKISRKREGRQQLIVMLGAVVITYFLCLLPFNVVVVLAILSPQTLHGMEPNQYLILLSATRVLFFINSCINPILYNAISGKFRAAFLRFFGFKKVLAGRSTTDSEYRTLMTSSCKINSTRRSMVSEISHDDTTSYCALLTDAMKRASMDRAGEHVL